MAAVRRYTMNLFTSYEALHAMTLGCAVMTNTYSPDAVADCEKIIDFIGNAYGVGEEYIARAREVILGELAKASTVQDFAAFDAAKTYNAEYTETDRYVEVKSDIVATLENLRKHSYLENPGWVDYSHYCVYEANLRYKKLAEHSVTGDLTSTRQVGILLALGIGCARDLDAAARKLLQCALWGDVLAARLLAYVAKLSGNTERAKYLGEYAELVSVYLDDGITVLPEEAKSTHTNEACILYIYTSSIKYDVVYSLGNPRIDFSFLEVIMSGDIDYNEKMGYIDEYDRKKWKKCTNNPTEAQKKTVIGF